MNLPRVRFALGRLMAWVAIISVAIFLVIDARQGGCLPRRADQTKWLVIAVTVAFGLGALYHPWISLAIALALWFALPKLSDGDGDTMCEEVYFLGWIIGAPFGWISRRLSRRPGRVVEDAPG